MPVTAVVPARNEERTVRACVESLLAQPEIGEILIADDSSTDRTPDEVRALAAIDARVRLISVPPLPAGWVGKNHALAVATRQARGEWLLLTDADTRHAPGSLKHAVEMAETGGYDLLSFSPEQTLLTFWEKAVIPRVYRELERLFPFDKINDPAQPAAAANGQYILIRRAAYDALGGHAVLRSEILEDVALARAAKEAGYRIHFCSGARIVRTRMYDSLRDMWDGWTKNLYPLGMRPSGPLVLDVLPLAVAPVLPIVVLAWVIARHAWYAWRLHRAGERVAFAAYYLPGSLMFSLLLLNSFIKYKRGRAVTWKGRAYAAAAR